MILVFSVIYTAISYEEVYDLSKVSEGNTEKINNLNEESFSKWR